MNPKKNELREFRELTPMKKQFARISAIRANAFSHPSPSESIRG